MIQTKDPDATDRYLAAFRSFEQRLNGKAETPLHRLRRQAIGQFAGLGFPTTRDEEWRYTSLAPLAQLEFQPAQAGPDELEETAVAPFTPAGLQGPQLVFVNGRYAPALSTAGPLPAGVRAMSLAAALEEVPDLVQGYLNHQVPDQEDAFAALNTAFLQDGAFIYLPRNAVLEAPIHLLFLSAAPSCPAVSAPRVLVVAESDSRATLIETCAGPQGQVYLTNALAEVVLGEGALFDYCKVQRESTAAFHLSRLQVHHSCHSRFTSHALSLGARLSRSHIAVLLDGEGTESTLNGLYLADGQQHVDHHTLIEHAQPRCASHELYKGILGGRATGVFRGKIHVRPGAQKTDAYQSNKNLLLSSEAEIDTKPQLEIYADDVKCSHGATVGQLDAEAIFYLRSRGLGAEEAVRLLTRAFAAQILERLPSAPLREYLDQLVAGKLAALTGGTP